MGAKRVIYIRVPEEERGSLDKFIKRVSKALRTQGAILRVEGDRIRVEVYGGKARIRDTIISIKKLLSEYKMPGSGTSNFKPNLIFKKVGSAVPLDALALLLRLEGWEAEYRGGLLSTNATLDDVVAMGVLLKDNMSRIAHLNVSSSVKKAVAVAMVETGKEGSELVNRAISEGLIVEYGKRLVPKTSWVELAKTLINLEKGQVEGG